MDGISDIPSLFLPSKNSWSNEEVSPSAGHSTRLGCVPHGLMCTSLCLSNKTITGSPELVAVPQGCQSIFLKTVKIRLPFCTISCHFPLANELTAKTLETLPILKIVLPSGTSGLFLCFSPNPLENIAWLLYTTLAAIPG